MTNGKRPNPLPILLPWHKILERLYILEERHGSVDEIVTLLESTTSYSVALPEALGKLVSQLPKIVGAEIAVVVKLENAKIDIIASNCSIKQANLLVNHETVKRLLKAGAVVQKKITTNGISLPNRKKLNYISVVPFNDESAYIFCLASNDAEVKKSFKLIVFTVGLLSLKQREQLFRQRFKRERERFELLADHLNEGMIILDKSGLVTLWNRPMQRLSEYSPKEAVGKSYQEVLRRLDDPYFLDGVIKESGAYPDRNSFTAEFELLTKSNQSKWVYVSVSLLRNSEQVIEQIIIIVRDVTQFKQLEKRKSEFISVATHELRTPITAIKGYLSLLARETDSFNEKQLLYLQRATDANNRLVGLAENLLRVAQVDEGRLKIVLTEVRLVDVLQKLVRDFTVKAEQKQISLTLATPPFNTTVLADEEKIEQVFANLIDNSIKYTLKGGVFLSFDELQDNRSRFIVTKIRDTGIGIRARNINEIFEKFHRSHRPDQVREVGAGLGLFIVKSFVEKQHGKITVQTKPGRGTVFSITLPAAKNKTSDE